MIYWIGYIFWVISSKLFFPCKVQGYKNLPHRGGFILASNHASNLDPMLIGLCLKRRLSYMAKDSLFKNKLFGFLLHQVGAFPIKRGAADVGALRETLKRLKNGCPVVVFPEGTRRKTKEQSVEIQSGIGFLAVKSRLPVIPVHVSGSDHVLPAGRRFPQRHPVVIRFGPPIAYEAEADYGKIAESIMKSIDALSSQSL